MTAINCSFKLTIMIIKQRGMHGFRQDALVAQYNNIQQK
jgi:hypothetical protein